MQNKPLLHIKSMVCPRCIMTVEDVLYELDIDYTQIELGEVSNIFQRNLNRALSPL